MTVEVLAEVRAAPVGVHGGRGFRVAIADTAAFGRTDRCAIAGREVTGECRADIIRISETDLRRAARAGEAVRRSAAEDDRDVSVMLDIGVVIDDDSACACRKLDDLERSAGVRRPVPLMYAGTPRGLAGLLADIHALGIADGVTLFTSDPGGEERRVVDDVLPILERKGLLTPHR